MVAEFGPGGVGAEFDAFDLGGPVLEDLKAGERNLEVWDSEERSLRYGRDDIFLGSGGSGELRSRSDLFGRFRRLGEFW